MEEKKIVEKLRCKLCLENNIYWKWKTFLSFKPDYSTHKLSIVIRLIEIESSVIFCLYSEAWQVRRRGIVKSVRVRSQSTNVQNVSLDSK